MRNHVSRSRLVAGIALGAAAVAVFTGTAGAAATAVGNALSVNGIKASKTPKPNTLVPLDKKGQFPASTQNWAPAKGRTYTGSIAVEGTAPAGTVTAAPTTGNPDLRYWIGTGVSIPGGKQIFQNGDVGVTGGALENPDCDGTFDVPTAPPGALCIYPGREIHVADPADPNDVDITADEAEIVNIAKNGEGNLQVMPWLTGSNGRYGARVEIQANGPGVVRFAATWAYTPAS
jgi:hypothetical protein